MSELVAGADVTPTIRLVRELGAGGMGTVWVADHLSLRTQVVVKFMSTGHEDASLVARFSREAAAASQVRSPHVVQVFDHGVTAKGTPFIVMELLEGEDLSTTLTRRGRLPLVEVVDLVQQVGLALTRAHAAQVVHRDVKPPNIFVCDRGDGRPFYKVLDFGIAKRPANPSMMGHNTVTGAIVGTPAYASPEQLIASKDVDHRTDLWALGVVAFKALTGSVPFKGENIGALALAVHLEGPPRATTVVPGLPSAVDAWFARACAVAAKDRFASAQEMSVALAAAASGDAAPSTWGAPVSEIASTESSPAPEGALAEGANGADGADGAAALPPTVVAPLVTPRARPAQPVGATQISEGPVPIATLMSEAAAPDVAVSSKAMELTTSAPSSVATNPAAWRAPAPVKPMMLVGVALAAVLVGGGITAAVIMTSKPSASATATGLAATSPPETSPSVIVASPSALAGSAGAAATSSSPSVTQLLPLAAASTTPPRVTPPRGPATATANALAPARPGPRPVTSAHAAPESRPAPAPSAAPVPTHAGKLF